jgi:acyl-CoA hydrolase
MLSISDTATEMVNWVFPEHAGAPGQIHGGRMMQWIATCGTIAASRVARGNVVLGAMDDIDFLHPVKVGEVAVLRAQVEYVGRCSLEVGVQVFAESPRTGERALTLSSHLVFVKVDGAVRPVPVPQGSFRAAPTRRSCTRRPRSGAAIASSASPGGPSGRPRRATTAPRTALAFRVVSLGPARGHLVRPGHVRREAPDGHRRGGRHPLDAL